MDLLPAGVCAPDSGDSRAFRAALQWGCSGQSSYLRSLCAWFSCSLRFRTARDDLGGLLFAARRRPQAVASTLAARSSCDPCARRLSRMGNAWVSSRFRLGASCSRRTPRVLPGAAGVERCAAARRNERSLSVRISAVLADGAVFEAPRFMERYRARFFSLVVLISRR